MRIPRSVLASLAIGAAAITGGFAFTSASAAPAAPVAATSSASSATMVALAAATDPSGTTGAGGLRTWWSGLSDAQQTCLKSAGLSRPVGPLTLEQRRALQTQVQAAAQKCDVDLPKVGPVRQFWNGLTQQQITCIQDTGITRPLGKLTATERKDLVAKVRAAAQKCGVNPPVRSSATPSSSNPA